MEQRRDGMRKAAGRCRCKVWAPDLSPIWASGPQLLTAGTASATWRRIVPLQVSWLLAYCPATAPDPVLGRLLRGWLVVWGLLAWHE
jgi:hypothetical protein